MKQDMATSVLSNECVLCVKTYDPWHWCDRWLSEYFFHVDDKPCLQIWARVLLQLALPEHFHVVASSQNPMRSNQHKCHNIPLLISDSYGIGYLLWTPMGSCSVWPKIWTYKAPVHRANSIKSWFSLFEVEEFDCMLWALTSTQSNTFGLNW